jgi:hypothetical protein
MRRCLLVVLAAAVFLALGAPGAGAQGAADRLDAYNADVDAEQIRLLQQQGFDLHEAAGPGSNVDLIATRRQIAKLRKAGVKATLTRVDGGQTVQQFARTQAIGGFNVWRSWDEPGGIRDQMHAVAQSNPKIAKLVRLGTTIQGREILAVKLSENARTKRDGSRPAALYSSTQHAREWIATEVNRRLMQHYVDGWRSGDMEIRRLLKRTELWFVLVANPDGYQYTFDAERLWRKNMRDNNGDGQITTGDGVDPNRNYPNHFGYDEEGSSSIPSSETFRGSGPASEPETRALKGLLDRVGFAFHVNWHSAGQWLLYAEGWQIGTPTADDPIYYALSGNLDDPAIPEFHPGLSADVLYVTNGETTDYAHAATGALAWTPELSEGCEGCGFVFPDDDALVQAEFERNLPFAHSVAKSADDPEDPESSLGIETKPFYLKSDDPYKAGLPESNFTFAYSYGDPQPVQVLALRDLGRVTLKYRINDGRTRSARTSEWNGGNRYDQAAVHYRQLRGLVTGTSPGDSVRVWFEARGGDDEDEARVRSESFTYQAVSESDNRVLVVAAEDYTGASPGQDPNGPHYLSYYLDALAANGISADVYDVDARGRTAPDHVGVLGHYDAAIWYTGDDVVTRTAGWGPGNAARLALDEMLEFRAFINEGGKVLYTGSAAGQQYSPNVGDQFYDPKGEARCRPVDPALDPRRCLLLRGSGDGTTDVLQYYFGAYITVIGDGVDENGNTFPSIGIDRPFTSLSWAFGGPDSADNQFTTSSSVATSGILTPDRFPQFNSWPASRWDKPGGPFAPHSGEQYVYSQIADVSYKRLTREIAVPAGGGDLTFWTSYDTEALWDHLAVEARTAGGDDWTTLPDANGHTTQEPGDSCPEGWRDLHPQMDRYQTLNADGTCSPTGDGGAWNAASGNSGGWQEWSIDLSAYAGGTVEISIAYISDWSVQNLGVFVDDVTLPDGTTTSFETDLGGWTVGGPAAGSGPNANDWERTTAAGFPVGNSIATADSLFLGFGIEGIAGAGDRATVLGRAVDHLLGE